jgi:hypothetical protein
LGDLLQQNMQNIVNGVHFVEHAEQMQHNLMQNHARRKNTSQKMCRIELDEGYLASPISDQPHISRTYISIEVPYPEDKMTC